MSSQARIPNELWSKMFGCLTTDSLVQLSHTNRLFCGISRPHLFSEFSFHPYALVNGAVKVPPSSIVQRAQERLAFWASPSIAPFVRSCKITPWERGERRGPKFSTSNERYDLLNAFFDSLIHFSGLHTLHAVDIRFTQVGLTSLCNLPSLRSLCIVGQDFVPGELIDTSSLKLKHLCCFEFRNEYSFMSGTADDWIPLLRLDELHKLEVTLTPHLITVLDRIPFFPQMRTLSVRLDVLDASQSVGLLAKFPALTELSMSQAGHRDTIGRSLSARVPPPVLPHLKKYSGVYQTLHMFVPLPTLTHLTVDMCPPFQMMAELKNIRTPLDNITTMHVEFVSAPDVVLDEFFGIFPALTRLQIEVADVLPLDFDFEDPDFLEDDPHWMIPEFLEALTKTPLPPPLDQLAVFWRVETAYLPSLPNFKKYSGLLMKKYPALKAVWFGLYGFTYRSRKAQDGTVIGEEAIADDNHETVKRMCRDFDSSWVDLEVQV
ncbi:L-aminoadipate-semialdehyde dehydrogenase [Mycena venus]|uniref:L-aminoadipate-semialdehyde dehydrogenase n=1 Tax=Mycena venus TaxID=2733690 RepID=A0A8H6Y0X7_9AGAR|nr:L-aminoadipate-semialdehyde dehydrogenase [Mycena venus]